MCEELSPANLDGICIERRSDIQSQTLLVNVDNPEGVELPNGRQSFLVRKSIAGRPSLLIRPSLIGRRSVAVGPAPESVLTDGKKEIRVTLPDLRITSIGHASKRRLLYRPEWIIANYYNPLQELSKLHTRIVDANKIVLYTNLKCRYSFKNK